MLTIGKEAPGFITQDIYGNNFSLHSLKGQKVYLSFLRVASCPFCNLRVNQLMQKQVDWKKKGIITIVVFASSAEEILQYAGKQQPPFPIIADPKEELYEKYGIGKSYPGMFKALLRLSAMIKFTAKGYFSLKAMTQKPILPGDFLIDEHGKIHSAYYGKDFGDHISFKEIDTWK